MAAKERSTEDKLHDEDEDEVVEYTPKVCYVRCPCYLEDPAGVQGPMASDDRKGPKVVHAVRRGIEKRHWN